jgi:hypothetical protein
MTLTECTVRSCPVDLVSTYHFWVVTMAATIGYCLSLEIFPFVVGGVAQPIKEGESLSCDRD